MLCGVYCIKNIKNNKLYIGSTTVQFVKRLNLHVWELNSNKHKNKYLQNSWNKYKEDSFIFEIIEICDKNKCLEREQYYIDTYKIQNLYNINPLASGTPNLSKETIEKRRQTMLKKYANGELEHIKEILRNKIPWNKGLTKKDINYSFLKVPKTITNNLKQAHINTSIRSRERSPEIYVYDLNYNYLGKWNSSKDLEDWSKTKYNNLPINSRFKTKRMGVPIKYLMSVNINKSCKTNKSYKGLYFTYKPLHQVIDDKKQDELLEV